MKRIGQLTKRSKSARGYALRGDRGEILAAREEVRLPGPTRPASPFVVTRAVTRPITMSVENATSLRRKMVSQHVVGRGVTDAHVVRAMLSVPRERFFAEPYVVRAFGDAPVPIGEDRASLPPSIVARMVAALGVGPRDRVLEIGTGSGYSAAVLASLAGEVYSVEIDPSLAARAAHRLRRLGLAHVRVRCGDGRLGWPEHAPYHHILLTASVREIPESLAGQIAVGGRLVVALGRGGEDQELVRVVRTLEGWRPDLKMGRLQLAPLVTREDICA